MATTIDVAAGGTTAASAESVHVLVVDDDREVRDLIRDYLTRHDVAVSLADGGAAMREVLKVRPVHIVILDLRMAGEDGLSLARYLRQNGTVGIIMLTASVEVIDRVIGLEVGADDYMAKPFDPRELLARVRSLARRLAANGQGRPAPSRTGAEIRVGRLLLNLEAQRLYTLGGADVILTAMEFDLLRTFAERPNRVLSRDQLLTLAHNRNEEAFDRSIDIRVLRLRKKIEDDPAKPRYLKTVRGSGYIFTPAGGQP